MPYLYKILTTPRDLLQGKDIPVSEVRDGDDEIPLQCSMGDARKENQESHEKLKKANNKLS
jgi:hypothetical protein